jgi:uncharacterized delta-60 repeat protein
MGTGSASRDFALARYNSDGTLDTSFDPVGKDGIVVTDVAGRRDMLGDMAIDGGGRIVAVGQANLGAGAGLDFALARYNPDGSLDGSFDGDGIVTTAVVSGDNFEIAQAVAIDAAGKVVAGGVTEKGDFIFDLALARYNADGSLDGTFGEGGKMTTNVGPGNSDDDLEGLSLQSDGKILVGGSTAPTALGVDDDFMVARYTPNGGLDGTFGSGGIVTTPTAPGTNSDLIFEIALQQDAKLVASGECDQGTTGLDVCVARYKVGEAD